jgi:hypothetical protein
MISSFSREELYHRHQLSHQQIDDFLGENKSGEYPETKAQHLNKLSAFLRVTELFEKEGIEFIPQKGPILSFRLYNDPLYRSYNDLDFLVNADILSSAAELLIKNGFETPFSDLPEDDCHRQLLYQHTNEIFFYSQEMETAIELHWNIFDIGIISPPDYNSLLNENKTEIQFEGHKYTVFAKEFEILFLVIHGGLHGWNKLKWLADIVIFLQRTIIDEKKFLFLTRQLKACRLVSVCNELIKVYFPGTKLLPATREAPGRMVRFAFRQINRDDQKKTFFSVLSYFRNSWCAFPGIRYKLNLFGQTLFATDLASVKRMPCSAFAYYIVSPFWKLWRGFR